MRWTTFALCGAVAISTGQTPVIAQPLRGDAASGLKIATEQCSSCHRVLPMPFLERRQATPDGDGPPSFQSVADLPSTTGLALTVFFRTDHKNMPNIMLSETQSDDLVAYILGLKRQ
jgi:mono/diheme cytochrome c family protein